MIGPPFAGKSTLGKLLAAEIDLPQVSLDALRWDYYREIGYDEALAQELRQKGGFLTVVAYWSLFNSHAIERTLADHANCIFDLGAGPIVFDNELQRDQIIRALAPFANVVRLLPSPDPERSIQVLQQRGSHLVGTNAQNFDWSAFFVNHRQNQALAKYELYTEGKTPAASCAEIIALTQTTDQVKTGA